MKRIALVLVLLAAVPLFAAKRRAVGPPSEVAADALGIGKISGAALAGTVASMDGTIVTLETGSAPPIRIEAKDAKILAADEMPRTAAEIEVGARITAYVESSETPGAPLPARLIMVESRSELMIAGEVESVDLGASTFTILGITVHVDDDTLFETAFPTFAPMRGLEDLAAGNIVKVDAALGANVLATRVLVVTPVASAPSVLRGIVQSISETEWVISESKRGDVPVKIDARTKIAGEPEVGDEVQVLAEHQSDGSLVAIMIVRLTPKDTSHSFHFKGWVQSIGPEQWTIGGPAGSLGPVLVVRINSATEIYANPKVGDLVSVKGQLDTSGNYTAISIRKAP